MDDPQHPKTVPPAAAGPRRYWRRLRRLTAALLLVWGAVTLAVPWFARDLNQWRFDGMPLGLWMASQGAIAVYLVLIIVYAWLSDRLERGFETVDRVLHD